MSWRVKRVEEAKRTITVVPHRGGRAPRFASGGGLVHDLVRQRMRELYQGNAPLPYLDPAATVLLTEGRYPYRSLSAGYIRGPCGGERPDALYLATRQD